MMENQIYPLVSVPVITYNSSKTVVETLDSIYNQTYPNIELIVSDDCSSDDTVQVCRTWLDLHKSRFARVELLTVEKNTGLSSNLNRAERICRGRWVKVIAGDDLLMPNCVDIFMKYINIHPDTICVFGQLEYYGALEGQERVKRERYRYFYNLSAEKQYEKLITEGCLVAAPCAFYNISKFRELGIENDERIPFVEDYPKWINLTKKGVHLDGIDDVVVKYRVDSGISTRPRIGINMFRSLRLVYYYYIYPELVKRNVDDTIQQTVDFECDIYKDLLNSETEDSFVVRKERDELRNDITRLQDEIQQRVNSRAYKLGSFLLSPIKWITTIIRK